MQPRGVIESSLDRHGQVTAPSRLGRASGCTMGAMRILMVAESFLPHMNGVTGSVLKVADEFAAAGDELAIIAPGGRGAVKQIRTSCGRTVSVQRVASVPMAGYQQVRVATTSALSLRRRISEFRPDIVHLASPTILGGRAMVAAEQVGVPTVAIYQTDIPGYTRKYGMPFLEAASWELLRDLHNRATLTRVHLWRRGVDTSQFSPELRSQAVRDQLADPGERIVVYVGRLAPEKQVGDLRVVHDIPGVRLVIVGDGPDAPALRRSLPRARFVGFKKGRELAELIASADLFIHPGELETFCQTIQEAMASGLPAIAPRSGGPIDLIAPSRTGWLYTPGMLDELRERAIDLLFDDAKREAFGEAALESVRKRTWPVLAEQLRGYYQQAIAYHARTPRAARRF